jgi:5-formyltetrahydrofolate cyclo-ligase
MHYGCLWPMPKKLIRKELLARRDALPAPERRLCGKAIQRRLLETALFQRSRVLGLYSPVRNEVPTDAIFRAALARGKRPAYPRVQGASLEFIEVADPDDLEKGAFGILEPKGDRRIALGEMDLLIVPGVAFDLEGGRLGYGKGFYDRLLADGAFHGRLVGLCYELQLLPRLPREGHDVLMDVVVTEQRTLFTEGPATVL